MLRYVWRILLICPVLSTALLAADSSPIQNQILPQTAAVQIPSLTLHLMTHRAGYIFQGMVINVASIPVKNPDQTATVSITFRVTQGFRGVRNGETLTIHEWAGLWSGRPRYRLGEQVVLFLYPQSRLGLTSPVGGSLGKFATDSSGQIVLTEAQSTLFSAATTSHPSMDGKVRLAPETLFQILRQQGQVEK